MFIQSWIMLFCIGVLMFFLVICQYYLCTNLIWHEMSFSLKALKVLLMCNYNINSMRMKLWWNWNPTILLCHTNHLLLSLLLFVATWCPSSISFIISRNTNRHKSHNVLIFLMDFFLKSMVSWTKGRCVCQRDKRDKTSRCLRIHMMSNMWDA